MKKLFLSAFAVIALSSAAKADIDLVLNGWMNMGGVPSAENRRVNFNAQDALVDSHSSEALRQSPEYQEAKQDAALDLSAVIQFAASCPDMGELVAPGVYQCRGEVQLHRFQTMLEMINREDLPEGLRINHQFSSFGVGAGYHISFGGHPVLADLGIERMSCQKHRRLMDSRKVVCTVVMTDSQ